MALLASYATPLLARGRVVAEDRNGDGRADVWRYFDSHDVLRTVLSDTDFDGRVDTLEHYGRAGLTRRDSDRDSDGRIDLVEEFAAGSTRAIVDVDRDGIADALLVSTDPARAAVLWRDSDETIEASEPTDGFIPAPLGDPFAEHPSYRPPRHDLQTSHSTIDSPPGVIAVTGSVPPAPARASADAIPAAPAASRRSPRPSRAPPAVLPR